MDQRDEAVLERIRAVFAVPRPEHFVNWQHCDECADHEETLQALTPDTASLAELGNPGWDPICFTTPAAYRYFLPGLARLAMGSGDQYYLDQFLFHLEQRLDQFDAQDREALRALLERLLETHLDELGETAFDLHVMGRLLDRMGPAAGPP